MTQSNWTERHDAFCLAQGIRPCAKLLWQWLSRQENRELEPDLQEFNEWACSHRGKPFHRDTLKQSLAQLVDCGVIVPLKRFTWRVWRVIIRSIVVLVNPPTPRKKSRIEECDRGSQPSNPQFPDDELIAVAALEVDQEAAEILEACDEAGIQFAEPQNVLEHPLDEVKAALELFQRRGGHGVNPYTGERRIPNPQGWLISCLRRGWHKESEIDNYYSASGGQTLRTEDLAGLFGVGSG